ncbi:VWA domain-containing protein [Actinacidiphila sp. bgisy167]|uniref:VWA domain-containing protein n=1 Tax=Actinacidiphila sp. bgisy167 TaxID=3413797 RepID=UPI003D704822
MAAIWNAAHRTGDHDTHAMLEHARAWCQVLGTDPNRPVPPPTSTVRGGELAEAVGTVTGQVATAETEQATTRAKATAARAARAAHARKAAATAAKVFTPGARPYNPHPATSTGPVRSPLVGTRLPTREEKTGARLLARALRAAAYREPVLTVTAAQVPPGRLNMRQALARDAQIAAGATPTATPFTRTIHRAQPTPPLRVGIAVDVSGSMREATAPIASAAWILAQATAHTDPDSRSATLAYDHTLTAITHPGRAPARVTEFRATGFGHSLADAIDALEAGVDLTRPGAGRLLVIASDGYYRRTETAPATARIAALRDAGCAVLWLAFAPDPRPLPGVTLLELTDPAQAVTAIAQAATTALSTT